MTCGARAGADGRATCRAGRAWPTDSGLAGFPGRRPGRGRGGLPQLRVVQGSHAGAGPHPGGGRSHLHGPRSSRSWRAPRGVRAGGPRRGAGSGPACPEPRIGRRGGPQPGRTARPAERCRRGRRRLAGAAAAALARGNLCAADLRLAQGAAGATWPGRRGPARPACPPGLRHPRARGGRRGGHPEHPERVRGPGLLPGRSRARERHRGDDSRGRRTTRRLRLLPQALGEPRGDLQQPGGGDGGGGLHGEGPAPGLGGRRHEQLTVEDAMRRVRLYFHPSFRERPRLSWLPGSLGEVSTLLQVDEVPGRDLLLSVHAPSLVERVERSRLQDLALRSSAAVMAAARDVQAQGGVAVALPALGGHHAGRAFYGGMCLLNDVALALSDLRARGPWRAAVVDTDAHHADGTLDLLGADASTMYLCVCTEGFPPPHPEKFDVRVGPGMSAEAYLEATLAAFAPRARRFRPDMLVWYLGYDLLEGEYASLGVGTDLLLRLGQALAGLSSPGTMPVLPAPEPVERDVLPRPRPASREWVEMTFGPLGSGRQEVNIGEETLTGRDVLLRMGIWGEDIDPIDIVTIEEGGRWALRCFDGEDRRVVVLEFSPRLDILSETRVHIREWMGDDYYAFDWPAGCPWPL